MARKPALIVTTLALLGALAVLAPAAGATKPCPAGKYCTDTDGRYVLEVPPLSTKPLYADLADCVWNVHVDFGDGSKEDYVFDASVGLTGSHVFPTAGTVYTVLVKLRDGHHVPSGDFCLNYDIRSEVLFRTAAEEADDPPKEEPPEQEPPKEEPPKTQPPAETSPAATQPATGTPELRLATPAADPAPAPYWQACRAGVLTHLVGCAKGRRVARAALSKLSRPGSASSGGFSCRLPRRSSTAISCARGEQRILVSLP